jgi:hypothetical protein
MLMGDPRPVVRAWASSDALFWDEVKARSVLEALQDGPGAGVVSVDAHHTLSEFDEGRPDQSWQPPARG